jgi:hypothetical protein
MLCATLVAGLAHSQGATNGSMSGLVTDPNDDPLPGVTVVATLTTTGTKYSTVTDAYGTFRIANVKVGQPYQVVASLAGFRTETASNLTVRLGENTDVDIQLQLEAATGEIVVVSESTSLISPTKMGVGSSVPDATIMAMPSLDRSVYDSARTNPVFAIPAPDEEGGAKILSVSGRNPRYNNISIDGAVNNDVFGLAESGTPGGQTTTQPIQLDAVQEVQLVSSTYDVRQGGFTGGSVNIITKSGTNNFHGNVFAYYSDDSLVGSGPDYFPEFGTYEDSEYGASLGGPIVKDKTFFFVNFGHNDISSPTGWSLDGQSGEQWQNGCCTTEAEEFQAFNEDVYGYNPGGFSEFTKKIPSDKFFARVDFNLSAGSTVTARYNYIDAANQINRPSSSRYEWPNEGYDFTGKTNSFVAQWNAVFADDKFNELRLTYQTQRDNRHGLGQDFPHVVINDVDGSFHTWEAGTEQYSTYNYMDQDVFEITDDFTFYTGNHEIVIGTHNEFYSFDNLFLANGYGSYVFDDLDAYYAGIADSYFYTYPNDPDNPSDTFDTYQLGLYAGDTWRVKPNLTLVYGLRVDAPFFPDKPEYNALAYDTFGVDTSEVPSGNALWSPRIGFNWDINGDGKMQLRGGGGLFTGRTPYVWISNNYGRTGTRTTVISAFDDIPFNPDPFNQPEDIGGASTQEINAVDPNFDFPQTWRFNLAYDARLPWLDMVATAEVQYAKSAHEINYFDLNQVHTGETLPFDGRPLYESLSRTFRGCYYLTNTNKGDATNYILKLEKPYGEFPLWGIVSYTHGEANVINEGTSSQARSNWRYMEVFDPNNVGLSTSDFQIEHRGMINVNYEFSRNTRWSTVVSVFWNRQSGKPWSNIYAWNGSASINTDYQTGNDLIYVPTGADDVVITNGTWAQLEDYLSRAGLLKYAGSYARRNASQQPYVTQMDLGIRQNIPIPGDSSLQISLDIANFWNLIDSDSGIVEYIPFGAYDPITYEGVTEDGKPIYELGNVITDPEDHSVYDYNYLNSRWKLRLGVRWSF